jgi:hypothetical protein
MLIASALTGFGAGGREKPSSLSLVASATGFSNVVIPTAVVADDLLVFLDFALVSSGVPTKVSPGAGWVEIADATAGGIEGRLVLYYKRALHSDAGQTVTGMVGDAAAAKALYVFRGDNPINAAQASSVAAEATDLSPSSQVVSAASGTPPLVVIAGYAVAPGSVASRGFTPAKDGEISVLSGGVWLAYRIYNASPANTTIGKGDDGNNNCLVSTYIAVT